MCALPPLAPSLPWVRTSRLRMVDKRDAGASVYVGGFASLISSPSSEFDSKGRNGWLARWFGWGSIRQIMGVRHLQLPHTHPRLDPILSFIHSFIFSRASPTLVGRSGLCNKTARCLLQRGIHETLITRLV